MRIFAAFPLPPAAAAGIGTAFSAARQLAPRVRWVSTESMHLTLHFFGEVSEDGISAFAPVFDDPDLKVAPIPTILGEPGFFPSAGRPRVLWVGLRTGVEQMNAFWKLLTDKLEPLRKAGSPLSRWSPEARGFAPHVTVARAGSTPLSAEWTQGVSIPTGEFAVTECVLFQSLIGEGGARYVPLKTIAFTGGTA